MSVTRINLSPIDHTTQVQEAQAAAAFTPGDLLEVSGGKIQRRAGASEQTRKMFALENPNNGGTIDDDYTADETARYMIGRTGDLVYAFLTDTVSVTDGVTLLISSATGGELQQAAGTEDDQEIVGIARQTVVASGKTRCKVEIV